MPSVSFSVKLEMVKPFLKDLPVSRLRTHPCEPKLRVPCGNPPILKKATKYPTPWVAEKDEAIERMLSERALSARKNHRCTKPHTTNGLMSHEDRMAAYWMQREQVWYARRVCYEASRDLLFGEFWLNFYSENPDWEKMDS